MSARVAAITGAGSGVGRSTAVALAQRGWDIALIGHGETSLKETAVLVEATGGNATVWPVDVADANAVVSVIDALEAIANIDVLINCAAVGVFGPIIETSPADLDRVMNVSANGVVHTSLAVAKYMVERKRGVIINIGSSLAFTAAPYNVPYGAAKAAVRSFSLGLGLETRRSGVTVCVAHLPAIATPWFAKVKTLTNWGSRPVGLMHHPDAVGEALSHLVERPRMGDSYLGFSTVFVVAGARLAPRLTGWFALKFGVRLQKTHLAAPVENNLYESVSPTAVTPSVFRASKRPLHWYPKLGSHRKAQ